ncbi:D-alanyl-D-alanine carboxypeptidase family protein [Butyrivibrio proteoclasticus]|uniref:D-alanyl-D-alanine carboxypeptidase family protein n=1 Tax=Butyrivibrio proteoclasticus TaxID=43305 RepID=UPI000687D051|nr:D-alanyl-D-alanine carboxypeptidase [Butyrivibrio proteoclasticus]
MGIKSNYRKRDGRRLSASEYRAKRKKEIIIHISLLILAFIAVLSLIIFGVYKLTHRPNKGVNDNSNESTTEMTVIDTIIKDVELPVENPYLAQSPEAAGFFNGYNVSVSTNTPYIYNEDVFSSYAVLVNIDDGTVVASKDGNLKINPASMTKILTLLVAVEHLEGEDALDDKVTMTQEIGDYVFKNDCSAVGFEVGEQVIVKDLLYGTILPSGADAAMLLAEYTAGSQEEFVALMNDKLKELGLSDTAHFTNCVGMYDTDHYCTLLDMAMILKAAEENELCHEVLSVRKYTTSATIEHPEGINISNLFLRRIEDYDTNGEVLGAKTGFVNQSGCCSASYMVSSRGGHYICVTCDAMSPWRCIKDHIAIYQEYTT